MFPSKTTKTFLSISLAAGPNPEDPISNEQFLSSFLDYGCWFRSVAAHVHLQTLERTDAQPIERLAALTAFYQLAGQAVEDVLSNLIAWTIWADDKNQSLPDIFDRLSLRFNIPEKPIDDKYIAVIKKKFRETRKRVDLHPREYLRALLEFSDAELPILLGIVWKRNPSVKLVPSKFRQLWDRLPKFIRGTIRPLTTDSGALLAACYNKVKHGPQLVVSRPIDGALGRGHSIEDIERDQASTLSVRLLMDGARTQETTEETKDSIRVAPFLIDDRSNIKRWYFQQLVHTASALYTIGTWIFNTTYKDKKRGSGAPNEFVHKIVTEQGLHLKNTFDEDSLTWRM